MNRWVFVGSSPSAPRHVAEILPTLRPCTTITTNAGIKLLRPDVYFLSDQFACQTYIYMALAARDRGTRLVTMNRDISALKRRGVESFDEFLTNGPEKPTRTHWGRFNMSGPKCMEYACRQGATEVHLLGAEGYSDRSYFDMDDRDHRRPIATAETNRPMLNTTRPVVACFDDVRFVAYGPLNYKIDLPNWEVV